MWRQRGIRWLSLIAAMLVLSGSACAARPLTAPSVPGAPDDAALGATVDFGPLQPEELARLRRLLSADVLVGGDDLQEVRSPLPYPFSALGLLVFRGHGGEQGSAAAKGEDVSICTGFMVSEDTVLTAAHCLYNVPNELYPNRPIGYREVVGFFPSYSRSATGAGVAPMGSVKAKWTDVSPEWVAAAKDGRYYWPGDVGVVRLEQAVGYTTGWFGLAEGCAMSTAGIQAAAKERAASADTADGSDAADAAAGSASISVAGFPGASAIQTTSGKLLFPLMGDQKCRVPPAGLCPADTGAHGSKYAGMLQHKCDTSKGMSGSPLWVRSTAREAATAAALARSNGVPGQLGTTSGSADAEGDYVNGQPAAVAVGVVSRSRGDCPWGADCVNLAAPMNARAISLVRAWLARP